MTVEPGTLVLVEGSYSCHPELWEHYARRVFLSVEPEEQLRRFIGPPLEPSFMRYPKATQEQARAPRLQGPLPVVPAVADPHRGTGGLPPELRHHLADELGLGGEGILAHGGGGKAVGDTSPGIMATVRYVEQTMGIPPIPPPRAPG